MRLLADAAIGRTGHRTHRLHWQADPQRPGAVLAVCWACGEGATIFADARASLAAGLEQPCRGAQ